MSTGSNETAAVVNAYETKKGNKEAMNAQNAANAASMAEQRRQYDQNRADLKPYMDIGYKSLGSIQDMLGYNGQEAQQKAMAQFRSDPGYQFSLDQGRKSIEGGAAARGGLYSGRTLMALNDYGQGMADQQYGNYYNRLWNNANMGRGTATGVADMGTNFANSMSGLYGQRGQITSNRAMGDARAMGTMASTIGANQQEGFNNGINTATSLYSAYMGGGGGGAKPKQKQQDWSGSSDDMFLNNRP